MATPPIVGLVALESTIAGATKALNAVKQTMADGLAVANAGQKTSLALGMSFEHARERLGGSLDGLRGSLDQRIGAGLQTLHDGLQGNTEGVLGLMNQQMLTGQNWKKTSVVFAKLFAIGGVQNKVGNLLAKTLEKSSEIYGTASQHAVDAIEGLSDRLNSLNLLGVAGTFAEAIGTLQLKLGPEYKEDLKKAFGALFQTGTDGLAQMSMLGMAGFREQLHAARGNAKLTQRLIEEGIKTAGARIRELTQNSVLGAGIWEKQLGKNLMSTIGLADQLNRGGREQNKIVTNFAKQWKIFKDEALFPLQQGFMELFSVFLPMGEAGFLKIRGISEAIVKWGKQIYVSVGGFTGLMSTISAFFKTQVIPPVMIFVNALLSAATLIQDPSKAAIKLIGKSIAKVWDFWATGGPTGAAIRGAVSLVGPDGTLVPDALDKLGKSLEQQFKDTKAKDQAKLDAYLKKLGIDVAVVAKNTDPGIDSASTFLDQTSTLLSTSIRSILGIEDQSNVTFGTMVEYLGQISQSTDVMANKDVLQPGALN